MKKLTYESVKEFFKHDGYILTSKEYINSHTKLNYTCSNGHEHSITYHNLKQGQRCSYCSNKIKLTLDRVNESFENEGYTLLTKEYSGNRSELDYICPKGHVHSTSWGGWKNNKRRCPTCAGNAKFTIGQVKEIKLSFEQEDYILLSKEYINSKTKLDYRCSKGHEHSMIWYAWQQGQRCPTCAGVTKPTLEQIRNLFEQEGYILLSDNYINNKDKLDYRCPNGHEHRTILNGWKSGKRCPTCAGVTKPTLAQVKYSFAKEGYVLLSNDYINNKIKLDYRCPKGHEHSIGWSNWNNGHRCITCCTLNRFGSNHPNWKGGISCNPYCQIWKDKEYKQDIRNRDSNRCLNPYCSKNNSRLTIHHIDYNKKNCHPSNLITVCNSCNSRANTDRDWHTAWYQALMYMRYKYK